MKDIQKQVINVQNIMHRYPLNNLKPAPRLLEDTRFKGILHRVNFIRDQEFYTL